jgi:holo-[acyl-carrier protein] synthase
MECKVLVGIGCDCIEIDRFRQAVLRSGDPFLHRLFTEKEIFLCQKNVDPVFSYAGRFAAKEALSKALGTGIGSELSWKDMEILNDSRGKPVVHWNIDVFSRFGVRGTLLTISHTHTIAIAQAVLE